MRFTQLERIITHNLGDGVIPILEWSNIHVGACEVIFLQNATTPFHQLETCEGPDVGHVASYNWNWPSPIYHELVLGGYGSIRLIFLQFLPRPKRGRTLLGKLERAELHQWGLMDRPSRTPEKGYGQ